MKISWRDIIPVWWSFIWRAAIFGMLIGALFGFFAGIVFAVIG